MTTFLAFNKNNNSIVYLVLNIILMKLKSKRNYNNLMSLMT